MTPQRRWLLGSVAAAAALAGVGGALWRETTEGLGPDFWALRFPRPDGGELALVDFRGRPLLLNFWATWCPPCIREMPALDRFWNAHREAGWQVLGLAVDSVAPVQAFLQRAPVGYAIGIAGLDGTRLARALGNEQGGLPFSAIFDHDGKLREVHLGELSATDLEALAARLR